MAEPCISLEEKQEALEQFKRSESLGMFIHWGIYSQAGGVWKGTTRINNAPYPGPKVAEWLMHAFQIPREEYSRVGQNLQSRYIFCAEYSETWPKKSGMKYVVITSKHHDGFALFDSESSEYDMVDATPYKADAVTKNYMRLA